jgi:hypothetical protein
VVGGDHLERVGAAPDQALAGGHGGRQGVGDPVRGGVELGVGEGERQGAAGSVDLDGHLVGRVDGVLRQEVGHEGGR